MNLLKPMFWKKSNIALQMQLPSWVLGLPNISYYFLSIHYISAFLLMKISLKSLFHLDVNFFGNMRLQPMYREILSRPIRQKIVHIPKQKLIFGIYCNKCEFPENEIQILKHITMHLSRKYALSMTIPLQEHRNFMQKFHEEVFQLISKFDSCLNSPNWEGGLF